MARFAAEMMKKVREMNYDEFQLSKKPDFKLRVGVCTGKVIAGVVGNQKPLYDIWGDTVNIASRMDYTGERGEIHVPEATARHLMNLDPVTGAEMARSERVFLGDLDKVMCRKRGDIKVKGKGIMTTYFVELTEDLDVVEKSYSNEEILESEPEKEHYDEATLTSAQIEMDTYRYIDEEDEDNVFPDSVLSKIDVKKDSGFGSQGHLEVGKVQVRRKEFYDSTNLLPSLFRLRRRFLITRTMRMSSQSQWFRENSVNRN